MSSCWLLLKNQLLFPMVQGFENADLRTDYKYLQLLFYRFKNGFSEM
jgi:hypothetical protein